MASKALLAKGEDEAAYLYGFLDPSVPARGPMRSEHPTQVGTLTSSTTLTLQGPTATPTPWTPGAKDDVYLTGVPGAALGDINIACGPIVFCDKTVVAPGAVPPSLHPAYVWCPDRNLNSRNIGTTVSGETSLMAVGSYTADFPGTITQNPIDGFTWNTNEADGTTSQGYRINGTRATVSVNSSLLESYGQVYVSDNGTYYPDSPADNYLVLYTGDVVDSPIVEDSGIWQEPFGYGEKTNRTCNAGPFKYGSTYESTFVPTNDSITKYRGRFPVHAEAAISSQSSTLGQPLINGPFAIISLRGVPAGSVVTICTTVSFEFPVRLSSSIGWLMAGAAYAENWIVNWADLARVPTGGAPGSSLMALMSTPVGKLGYGMATGVFPKPPSRRTVNIGITSPSSTGLLTEASRSATPDITDRLQEAAGTAHSTKSWFTRAMDAAPSVDDIVRVGRLGSEFYRGYVEHKASNRQAPRVTGGARITEIVDVEPTFARGKPRITGGRKRNRATGKKPQGK